jgi:hypothetical protein
VVRIAEGEPEEGFWAIVEPDHPAYPTFKRYLEDYERRVGEAREE